MEKQAVARQISIMFGINKLEPFVCNENEKDEGLMACLTQKLIRPFE